MALLIKNGEIVTAQRRFRADIWCEGETISQIGEGLSAPEGAEVIDATGKLVFPGFIDPHTHIYLPFMGTYACDDYESATRAAVVGGTTTLFDMCVPGRGADPRVGFATWCAQAEGKAACDYAFHIGACGGGPDYEAALREVIAESGQTSLKVFLAYKGALGVDDTELYAALKLARDLGLVVTAHCENETLIAEGQAALLAAGRTGPEAHYHSRPPRVEAEGVHHFLTFAELTDCPVYIVHLSCEDALNVVRGFRDRGVHVGVETLIQYLILDQTFAELDDFEGAKYVMSPPLRGAEHQAVLWAGLAEGDIDTVATDHAPFRFADQKTMGRGDFTKIPNGIPAVEERVSLLWTEGVCRDRLSVERFVEVASTAAARQFGLYPRKGQIAEGSDADLVVFDPGYHGRLGGGKGQSRVDYCAFEGMEISGRPSVVTVRGEVAARDGIFVGTPGRGRLLKR